MVLNCPACFGYNFDYSQWKQQFGLSLSITLLSAPQKLSCYLCFFPFHLCLFHYRKKLTVILMSEPARIYVNRENISVHFIPYGPSHHFWRKMWFREYKVWCVSVRKRTHIHCQLSPQVMKIQKNCYIKQNLST